MLRRQQEMRTPRVWTLICGLFSTELPFTRRILPKWSGRAQVRQVNREKKTCFWPWWLTRLPISDILEKQGSCHGVLQILRSEPGRRKLRQPITPYLPCGKLCLVMLTKRDSRPRRPGDIRLGETWIMG